ncbi:HNH endonuclease [Microbacterium sp. LRZ72]|uniref:HNH endonuclease signature motif containing protein n=1 Tax=Microbacterium sp. LRZ72 TaxID=2942481 RepID=UPI0029B7625C|nr:DUF222 domain-containing protein [Microbacterium sp. LRZ72]MDX2376286.1 HNH endonuclease [Microbacterium sp. LRZ72]
MNTKVVVGREARNVDGVDAAARDLAERYAAACRAEAAAQAAVARVLAEAETLAEVRVAALPAAAAREAELPVRALAAELGAAARQPDRTVQRRMDEAAMIARHFAATLDAWEQGAIARGHVTAIVDHGMPIQDSAARAMFEREALERAAETTPGRLRAALGRLSEDLQPRSLTERHQQARAKRGTSVQDLEDGMGGILIVQPITLIRGIQDRLTEQAKEIKNTDPDEPRTLDQIRADIAADTLLTSTPNIDTGEGLADGYGGLGSITAVVNVTVSATALAGITAEPAELVGRAPVDIDTARELAGRAPGWERVLTDPITGGILAVDRYTPSADMKRHLRVRDQHCRFPGCRQPVHRCDFDHTLDYASGGRTEVRNLAALCRRHHTVKGETPWKVKQLDHGVLEWTSPGGLVYIDTPPSMVRFTDPEEPAPF